MTKPNYLPSLTARPAHELLINWARWLNSGECPFPAGYAAQNFVHLIKVSHQYDYDATKPPSPYPGEIDAVKAAQVDAIVNSLPVTMRFAAVAAYPRRMQEMRSKVERMRGTPPALASKEEWDKIRPVVVKRIQSDRGFGAGKAIAWMRTCGIHGMTRESYRIALEQVAKAVERGMK